MRNPLRPFDFMVLFWGKRYRDYFVDRGLPSLLAPNNIPLLEAEDGHRFLIAAPREDWSEIKNLPVMERLRLHATPTWIEIGEPEAAKSGDQWDEYTVNLVHMGKCLRMLFEAAHAGGGYGCSLLPDVVVSDGMVACMLKSARAGHHLVLCSSTRQVEEPVLAELERRGLFSHASRLSLTAEALTVPPRLAADLGVRFMHPELLRFEEESPDQHPHPPFRLWRVPGDRGIILHTFFVVPILMDYAVVPSDHTACLDRDTFENIYISANFSHCGGIHIVQDSDELVMLSLTPEAVNWTPPPKLENSRRSNWLREYERLHSLRRSLKAYAGEEGDRFKCDLFRVPFRWNAKDLDDVWFAEERRIDGLIDRAVGDYFKSSRSRLDKQWLMLELPLKTQAFVSWIVTASRIIAARVGLAIRGDPQARDWFVGRVQVRLKRLLGR